MAAGTKAAGGAGRAGATVVRALRGRVKAFAAAAVIALLSASAFAADPQIASFSEVPDPVPAGGLVTYTARIDNNALDAGVNVRVVVPVPAGATFASASAPCVLVAGSVECNLGSVAGSGTDTRSLAFVFRATGPGPTAISATATLSADNDINLANNVQTQTTTVIEGGDLRLAKTATPNPVVGGTNISYALTASNAGPNTSGDIVITDNLPPSVAFVSSSGAGWSCANAGSVVTCTHPGPHAPNAAIPALGIVGQVNAAGGNVTNSASVAPAAGGTADPDSSNNTATVNTAVLPGADVRIAQKIVTSQVPAIAGQNVTFQIEPRNSGPAGAVNAVVTDNLPAGWTFVSATGPNWTCGHVGQAVSCTRAAFPAGAADDITVVATAPPNAAVGATGTTYTNTAAIASDTPDPVAANNSGSVNINVLPDGADLRISKTKTPNPVALGSNLTSTIRVTNNGPRTATGALRVIELLTGETYVSASGSGWVCVPTGSTVVCSHPNGSGLAVGASLPDLVIVSRATVAGVVTNNACTGSSVPPGADPGAIASPPLEGDANNTNDCQSVSGSSTTVQPDLGITKRTSTPTGVDKIVSTSESSVTYTLVVSNLTSPGVDAATGIVIRDTVPAFITGRTTLNAVIATVSAGNATFNCAVAGADVTCTQTGGQLQPGQTVTVPITVNRPMQDGSFTNTATVGNTVEGDPNAANNSASDTVQIDPIADVELTGKTVTPAAVRAGEQATYVISYRNNGPSPALNVSVGDVFSFAVGDPGATVLSINTSKPGSTCSIAAGAVLLPGNSTYACTIGTLANGETQSITLVVRPNFQLGNPARSFGNVVSITTSTVENPAGGNNGNNSKPATLGVNPAQLDLLTNKIDFEDPVLFVGNAFLNYRVAVTNNGPSFATNARISEAMTPPAGKRIRFVCDTTGASSAVCNAPSLCSVVNVTSAPGVALPTFFCALPAGNASTGLLQGELAATQTKNIFLRFEALDQPAPNGDIFNNVATVTANEPDSFPANDASDEQTTARQRIDLAVRKSVNLATVNLRQPFVWTVAVTNNGPADSAQTDLTDTLPPGVSITGPVTYTTTSPAGTGTCTVAAATVQCGLGRLNNGGVSTITIPARIDTFPAGGTLTNSAIVDTDPNKIGGIDPVPGNNSDTSTVTVTRASLAGTVFQDRDRVGANGGTPQAPPLEPRIPGVSLTLAGTDAYGNVVTLTTTTDASGNYVFNDLSPSNAAGYTVTETQPAGFVNSPANPPAAGAGAPSAGGTYAAGGAAGNSSFSAVVLGGNTTATDYNFPEVRRPSLGGFLYIDVNQNNVRDAGVDLPIASATVLLRNAATGALIATTTTDATGAYAFASLDPLIVYTIEEPLPAAPAGLRNGPVNPGLVNGAACATGCTAQPNTPSPNTDRIASIDLGAGTDGTQFNFGELQQTVISGTVYIDRNRNGTIDATPTDGRIPGVTVRLVQGASCAAGTVLQTTTTAADGSYAFGGAIVGQDYLVCEAQPAGYAEASVNPGTNGTSPFLNTISITNLPLAGSPNNQFGERVGSLAGTVFLDANNDGARAGDAGIAGVVMTLSGTDAAGNPVNRTATTDATGAWRFDDLLAAGAGGYTVTEQAAQPVVAGKPTLNGKTTAGSAGGTASAVAATPSAIRAITLGAGVDGTDNNFGEILPVALSGTVFIDLNNNGVQNPPGDTGLAGVPLVITGIDDTGAAVTRNVTTNPDGTYSVPDLRPGTYTVTEPTQPAGTANGLTVPGSAGGSATPPATVPSAIAAIVLTTPGGSSTGNNFAEIPNSSSLAGRVWLDLDNNGAVNGAELGIAGITIELSGTDLSGVAVTRTTTTDALGNYVFANLGPGVYTLREPTQPAQTLNGVTLAGSTGGTATGVGTVPSAIAAVTLGVGQASINNNFAEIPAAAINGRVYGDNNNNGSIDAGEAGIAGVAIVLTGTDDQGNAVSVNALTDASGSYSFANLRPGTYTVTEPTQPLATVNGITSAGTIGGVPAGTATAPAVVPSAIAAIVLPAGATSVANNFGEIGNSPDLLVSKASVEARFTVNNIGSYTIRVRNGGQAPTVGPYRVTDRLPTGLTLDATPTGTGWACVGAAAANTFTCTATDVLAAGAANPNAISVKVRVGAAALPNSPVNNAVLVEGGGELDARAPTAAERDAFLNNPGALPVCVAAIAHNVCRQPTPVQASASISGTAWYDTGSARGLLDAGDRRLPGWIVEVLDAAGNVVARAVTAADGSYRINDLLPGVPLTVRFRDPQSNVVWGYPVNGEAAPGSSGASCDQANAIANGTSSSCAGSGVNPALTVVLAAGQNLLQQSLPVDPSGVVYDSRLRQPVPGAVVTLAPVGVCAGWNPATGLVAVGLGGYTVNGGAVSMTVGNDGLYQFLFAPAAPASCTFGLTVTPPAGYTFVSTAIPPSAGPLSPPGGPGSTYPVQPQASPPTAVPGAATSYFLTFTGGSGGANIIHNHIPLDPATPTGLALSKTGDKATVELGDSIRYTLTVLRSSGPAPRQVTIVDRLPAGFTFIAGTAIVNGVPIADPAGKPGPRLAFNLGPMPANGPLVLQYRARVGVGSQQGDGINRANGFACGTPSGCVSPGSFAPSPSAVATNEAQYRVRVTGGVFTTDACVLGKVFVDCNGNHVQDKEELGIPGVRLVMSDGTTLVSDSEGKYSMCGLAPRSHVLKVDPYTLPRGSRLTTSSNRNLGDAGSLWLDLKNGELHRADFIEGSCSNTVLEQVKARRAQGEVRTVEPEKKGGPALRFDSKAHGLDTLTSPQQGTDGANQLAPKPRDASAPAPKGPTRDESNLPVPDLPLNRPPPPGRSTGDAPTETGGSK